MIHERTFPMRRSLLLLPSLSLSFFVACAAPPADDAAESSEQAAVSDIAKMTARGDGTFDVECRDGRKEIVSAADVTAGRVCKPAVMPASPFGAGACTGTPMTEADALERLGTSTTPVSIGSFALALRHRTPHFEWDARGQRWSVRQYTWDDAPNDALVAYRDTESESTRGVRARFAPRGSVELARDANGAPFVRLVGEAANVTGPDTTRFMRVVSEPMRPWASPGYPVGPTFVLEESQGAGGAFRRVTDWGFSVQLLERAPGNYARSWWFTGNDVTAIVTERCGQLISAQSMSGLSPVEAAIGIYLALD
jgi:hypothetical protein